MPDFVGGSGIEMIEALKALLIFGSGVSGDILVVG